MKQAVDAGRRISDVADLNLEELRALIQEDWAALPPGASPQVPTGSLGQVSSQVYLDHCLKAVDTLDRARLEKLLDDAAMSFSRPVLRRDIIVPLLHTIGDRWRGGELRVVHEHMASAIVRSHLATLRDGFLIPESAARLVVTTPAGQLHEFGALLVATAAVESGWDVIYLGPNLPAEEIATAAQLKQAKAVALSIIYPSHDPRLHEELRNLRRYLGKDLPILVGGRSAKAFKTVLEEIEAIFLDDLAALTAKLEEISS